MNQDKIIDIEDLTPDAHNFNQGTDEGRQLMQRSLSELGAGRSILVDRNGNVIAGNKTQEAAIKAGIRRVRVIETDGTELVAVKRTDIDIDSAKGRELALVDNLATQVNLAWDEAELEAMDVEGFDPGEWGWEPPEMGDNTEQGQGEQHEAKEDDFDETKEKIETVCKKGDIWQLGNHRLVCGSCTDPDAMSKLMGGERADIAFTSPPYNMMQTGFDKALSSGRINVTYDLREGTYNEFSDNLSDEEYGKLLKDALKMALTYADDALYNIGILASSKIGIIDLLSEYKKKFCDILVWNKSECMPFGLPSMAGMVPHICELIFCFNQNGSRSFSHPQWKGCKFNGKQMDNRIDSKNQSDNEFAEIHHATFPVEFAGQVVAMYSEKSVLDQFGGTGTTMIAAEQLGRKCFMMELDPHYCDVIIARWEKLTGGKATKLNP